MNPASEASYSLFHRQTQEANAPTKRQQTRLARSDQKARRHVESVSILGFEADGLLGGDNSSQPHLQTSYVQYEREGFSFEASQRRP